MNKPMVILEIGDNGLAQVFSTATAIALSEALYDAAEKAEKENRTVSVVSVSDKEDGTVAESLPDQPPEPEGVADRFSPAVQEAMEWGDNNSVADAPKAIIDLANEIYQLDVREENATRVRQAIRLLQQVVEGP